MANARYIVFSAMALHDHPDRRAAVADGKEAADRFTYEVRRFFPFIPFIGGRVREPFTWGRRDAS